MISKQLICDSMFLNVDLLLDLCISDFIFCTGLVKVVKCVQ